MGEWYENKKEEIDGFSVGFKNYFLGGLAVLLTSRDGRDLIDSEKMLLSLSTISLNSEAYENFLKPQKIIFNYGGEGWVTLGSSFNDNEIANLRSVVGPAWVSKVNVDVNLRHNGSISVYPLDSSGVRLGKLDDKFIHYNNGSITINFQSEGQYFSPWYEIVSDQNKK